MSERFSGAARVLRLGGSFLLSTALALGLLAFGRPMAALGVAIGWALHLANSFLLYLTLASLASPDALDDEARSSKAGRALAGFSSVGRLLLLGLALWATFAALGREAALGAGGGLALAQVSFLISGSGAKGGA